MTHSVPEGYLFIPDTQAPSARMFIIGSIEDFNKNWFAFFSDEKYRKIFEKEFIEILNLMEKEHIL